MQQSAAFQSTRPRPFAALARRWRLLALIVVGFGPFVPSLLAMRDFLLADNALGFVPFMLPFAAYLFWVHGHDTKPPATRDVLLDVFFSAPLLLGAFFVLAVTPARLSWYFWLDRVDLLAFALFVSGAAVVFLGYQQVLRVWPAVVALFLGWPYFVVWVQNQIAGPFVTASAWIADRLVGFLSLPYAFDPGVARRADDDAPRRRRELLARDRAALRGDRRRHGLRAARRRAHAAHARTVGAAAVVVRRRAGASRSRSTSSASARCSRSPRAPRAPSRSTSCTRCSGSRCSCCCSW